jgi:hypothetical protein
MPVSPGAAGASNPSNVGAASFGTAGAFFTRAVALRLGAARLVFFALLRFAERFVFAVFLLRAAAFTPFTALRPRAGFFVFAFAFFVDFFLAKFASFYRRSRM